MSEQPEHNNEIANNIIKLSDHIVTINGNLSIEHMIDILISTLLVVTLSLMIPVIQLIIYNIFIHSKVQKMLYLSFGIS